MTRNKRPTSSKTALSDPRTIVYTIAALLTLAGLTDAACLSVQAFTGETLSCGGSTGCFKVLGSVYARVGGMPVALLGMLGYFSAFSFAVLSAFNYARARIFFAWNVWAMFLCTLWLLSVQAFLLHAFCRYCLVSAAIIFLLTGLTIATRTRP